MANFKSAFASARKAGKSEFTWNGNRYNTKLASDTKKAPAKAKGLTSSKRPPTKKAPKAKGSEHPRIAAAKARSKPKTAPTKNPHYVGTTEMKAKGEAARAAKKDRGPKSSKRPPAQKGGPKSSKRPMARDPMGKGKSPKSVTKRKATVFSKAKAWLESKKKANR